MQSIKADIKEREERWTKIEHLIGLSICDNPGMEELNEALRPANRQSES